MACQSHTGNDGEPELEPRSLAFRPVLSTNGICIMTVSLLEGSGLQAGRSGLSVPYPGCLSENLRKDV